MKKHYIKRLFATVAVLLCCVTVNAHDFEVDGFYYKILSLEDLTVEVTYKGDYYNSFYNEYTGDVIIPSTVTYKSKSLTVTSIGNEAFSGCSGLTSITIPNSVTSIGERAFFYCSGLTSVTIPNSVTSIGDDAFENCKGLKEVHISDLAAWCNISFKGSTANPLYYAKNIYLNGELVTDLVISNSVTTIGNYAFSGCSGLTNITIPNSVTSIGDHAFAGCSGLTSITIPNSVTTIGDYAFFFCKGLTSITIPNSVTTIGKEAFEYCSGLTSVTIPNSVISIGDYAFSECSGLTSITIPNSVTTIGYGAFQYCFGLTSITIPNSVTSIGKRAFEYCSGLTSITIPNSVTTIGEKAFYNCKGLTSVTIGSEVGYIYSEAFANCENLVDIYCLATIVPSTYSDAFNESYPEYMTLHVPASAISDYKKAAPWSSFGNIVTLDGEIVEPEVKICATPVISYSNGKLSFECETEGAEFITDVTCSDIKKFYDSEINFSATYNISVYATATGFENSDTVNATLCWVENGDSDEDDTTNIITVPAVAVLVTSANGAVTVSCSLEGETVAVYTTDGTLVGSAAITNGSATIQSGLSKGSVAIVKIGNKSVKVVVD